MTVCRLDTCVIIDYLRNRPEAVDFVHQAGARPAASAVTAADLAAALTHIGPRREEGLMTWQPAPQV